ncbi:MAG: type I secretion system permease/ATPase [Gammaproteobacteria bacterium]|nr:type I secretion system permease/ATPase [Gammaproteobacteria bacterium]
MLTSPQSEGPLLQCLQFLAEYYGRPISPPDLKASLSLRDSEFSEAHFLKASQSLGFISEKSLRPFSALSHLLQPAVLCLKDNRYAVWVKQEDKATATLYVPEKEEVQSTPLSTLKEVYTGTILLFQDPSVLEDQEVEPWDFPKGNEWFWNTLKNHWRLYAYALVATVLLNVFVLASPLFIMIIYDRVVPNSAFETLWVLSIGVMGIALFDFIVRSIRAYLVDFVGKRTDFLASRTLLKQILSLKMEVKQKSAGAIANTLREFESIRDFMTSATLTILGDFPFVLFFILVIALIGGATALVPLSALPLVFIAGKLIQMPLSKVVNQGFQEAARKNALLFELLHSIETIKSAGLEPWAENSWEVHVGKTATTHLKSRLLSALATHFAQFVLMLATVALMIVGVYEIDKGQMTLGGLIACVILNSRVMGPLVQIAQILVRYQSSAAAFKALNHIMSLPIERPPQKQFIHRKSLQGEVEFQELSFTYPESPIETLKNLSFNVKSGERVGIVGRIGSGKSTLLKMVSSLYEPKKGACLIDGLDVRQIDPTDVRRNIGFVQQDVVLFYGTIRDNITFGAPFIEDERILTVSKISGVDYFIRQHPSGFDQIVGERGEALSGGQRQAIVIARALLLDPPIILLDEPTAHMDHTSEQTFIHQLTPILANKTLLLVTHRTSLLNLVNRLIVIDRGEVVADGPKEIVLKKLTGQ